MHTISTIAGSLGRTAPRKSLPGGRIGRHRESWLMRILEVLAGWQARADGRRALAQMDATRLKDIGRGRLEIEAEIRKPFWRA